MSLELLSSNLSYLVSWCTSQDAKQAYLRLFTFLEPYLETNNSKLVLIPKNQLYQVLELFNYKQRGIKLRVLDPVKQYLRIVGAGWSGKYVVDEILVCMLLILMLRYEWYLQKKEKEAKKEICEMEEKGEEGEESVKYDKYE